MLSQAFALYTAGRVQEAFRIIEGLAEAGDPDATYKLGEAYWRGTDVPQDIERAWHLFRQASNAGQPVAVRLVTNLLANGTAVPRDWREALRRLEAESTVDAWRAQMLALVQAMDLTDSGDPRNLPRAEQLSEQPFVQLYRDAFTAAECDFLKVVAEPMYERCAVFADGRDVADQIRTSDGAVIHWLVESPPIHAMNRRLAALTGTSVEQGEPLQILRYSPGQEYRPHTDWLNDENKRVTTALVYLNDEYEGGETSFPSSGLRIRGRKGDALVFRSATADGREDPLSEHAGLPVTSGTKYLASRWIRERRYDGKPPPLTAPPASSKPS